MKQAGLILEGGGTRGVFSAGVLDYFMEQNLYLPYVIGVSAGACNAVNYVAHQHGRSKECMIDYLRDGSYAGLKYLIKKRSLFDMDLIFDVFPNSEIPFDYKTFFESDQTCILTATNCLTGKAEYLSEKKNKKRIMAICRASSSLPLVAPIVMVDDIPMMDGGMSDSIPIRKALKDGCKKAVIILTRNKGYIKKRTPRINKVSQMVYKEYPNLVKAIKRRPDRYNKTIEYIEKLEEAGKIFVIRPEELVVKQAETNPDVLYKFYQHGYEIAKQLYPSLIKYLEA
ncbi:patatin-like phospholipase family protein [Candidatus Galacturonibacter soehngenii]|uniref:Patatin family protein n=1 Tax=Candidatus Galacturonatibacter soehngenii TaxID=2307010 RepID=A0A7V7QLW7_9FIRM|nr:patatin family protein [Candidatus Galacturonibacter soehngenii]KAB1439587.1 patatin family protein [Candidatus Galacturonibacter soehngenii]MBA4687105.1 patatin family protein [Candidatus Galacturonibacter soehngenii]